MSSLLTKSALSAHPDLKIYACLAEQTETDKFSFKWNSCIWAYYQESLSDLFSNFCENYVTMHSMLQVAYPKSYLWIPQICKQYWCIIMYVWFLLLITSCSSAQVWGHSQRTIILHHWQYSLIRSSSWPPWHYESCNWCQVSSKLLYDISELPSIHCICWGPTSLLNHRFPQWYSCTPVCT